MYSIVGTARSTHAYFYPPPPPGRTGRISGTLNQCTRALVELPNRVSGSHSITKICGLSVVIRGEVVYTANCFADSLIKVFPGDFGALGPRGVLREPTYWPDYMRPCLDAINVPSNMRIYDVGGTLLCSHRIH